MATDKKGNKGKKTPITSDERFSTVHSDPRFRMPKRNDFKVEVDDRFSKSDLESVKRKAKIDKYGRKVDGKDDGKSFNKYYQTKDEKKSKKSESDESGSDGDSESDEIEDDIEEEDSEEEEEEESDVEADPVVSKLDRARGEGVVSGEESSSDESSSDEESSEEDEESEIELEPTKPESGDPFSRFAVVNLDWDHVKSVDLMATFQSFVSSGGSILSVSIYPSEFGKERMQREEIEGPPKDLFKKKKGKKDESDSDSDSELEAKDLYEENDGKEDYDSKSLRRYQLQRLRYYYAVVVCDSIKTAKNIYDNCDGTEYESTANFFDLRFIPDEMEFDDDARDTCNKIPSSYKPETFVTDALQHSKVKLTWDETPAERVKLSSKAFSQRELDDMDFKAYLASDNSDEEEENEDLKNRYKNLAGSSSKIGNRDIFAQANDEDDVDMEITFTPGADISSKDAQEDKSDEEETTVDKLRRKAKERRKSRKDKIKELKDKEIEEKRASKAESKSKSKKKGKKDEEKKSQAELELLMLDEKPDERAEHFDLKEIVRSEKEKSKKSKHRNKTKIVDDDFKADLNDPRFNEIFTNHDFAIDPSQPQFKKTSTMQKILDERNKRRENNDVEVSETKSDKPTKSNKKRRLSSSNGNDVHSLVQKLKRKSKK